MDCVTIRERLDDCLDENREPDNDLARHVETCPACARHYAACRAVGLQLSRDAQHLRQRIPAGLEASIQHAAANHRVLRPARSAWRWVALAASVALVVAIGVWWQNSRTTMPVVADNVPKFVDPIPAPSPVKTVTALPTPPDPLQPLEDEKRQLMADLQSAQRFLLRCVPGVATEENRQGG